MNCTRCGAPLSLVEGRGHFRCDFCSSLQFVAPLDSSADRVVPLDETVDQQCPVCRVPLGAAALEGIRVRLCRQCRGILIDREDFADVIHLRRREYLDPPVTPPPMNHDELRRRIQCPECHAKMATYPYGGPGAAVIDCCDRCDLLWLDHGEIATMEKAPGKR